MSLLNKQRKAINMKRLEGQNMAREGAIMLGLLKFNGKKYILKRPLHALGIVSIGAFLLHRGRRMTHSTQVLNQFRHLSRVSKIVARSSK